MNTQASGRMREKRAIRKLATLLSRSRKLVIRKPDSVKNSAMPTTATAPFMPSDFGPTGSRWPASTSRMLTPRQPSSTGSLLASLKEKAPSKVLSAGGLSVHRPDQVVANHDAVGFDQLREMALVVRHEGAELEAALLVQRDGASEIDRARVELLD